MLQEEVIKDIVVVYNLIVKLYNGNRKNAIKWLFKSNSYFFGKSPMRVIIEGDGKFVVHFLKERLGEL